MFCVPIPTDSVGKVYAFEMHLEGAPPELGTRARESRFSCWRRVYIDKALHPMP
jgi:hypothetical protein